MQEFSSIIDDMLSKIPRERNYNAVFGKIAELLMEKHSFAVPALDLRLRFTLFMQEEFDAVPKDQWRLNDMKWLADMEQKAKERLLAWISEQIKKA